MSDTTSALLTLAGTASLAIAMLQFVMYFGGPAMYRYCGTPEFLIAFRVRQPVWAFLLEVALFCLFSVFAAYAFSGAGWIRPLPWRAPMLAAIAVVYLLRGLLVIVQLTGSVALSRPRDILYSFLALAIGMAYAVPTWPHWRELLQLVDAGQR